MSLRDDMSHYATNFDEVGVYIHPYSRFSVYWRAKIAMHPTSSPVGSGSFVGTMLLAIKSDEELESLYAQFILEHGSHGG